MSIFDSMNFNLEEDYKVEALIPEGTKCNGSITKVVLNEKAYLLQFEVCMNNNPGMVKADGESEVDGTHLPYKVWLPKPGDEKKMTKSGKQTTYQWKINNMAECFNKLGIVEQDPASIKQAIDDQSWVGIDVVCEIGINEYKGKITNQIDNMEAELEEPF